MAFAKEFKMKIWTKAAILVALLSMMGCDDSDENSAQSRCEQSVCADANTLQFCSNGVSTDITCPNGCSDGACVSSKCTTSYCLSDSELNVCTSAGSYSAIQCPFGCENGVCKTNDSGNADAQCSIDVCKSSSKLLECQDGVQVSKACDYGCENGACKSACTANFCSDSTILMVCVNGTTTPTTCPYGCDATTNTCKTATQATCTEGAKQCSGSDLQTCTNGNWVTTTCANGCENGSCKASSSTACTSDDNYCSGGNAYQCIDGAIQYVSCGSAGCENGACKAATTCTSADNYCNNGNAYQCVNGAMTIVTCKNGCENGACTASSTTAPTVGSTCTASDDYVCTDSTFYYCSSSYQWAKTSCSGDGMACAVLSDGSQDCVYTGLEDYCENEGDQLAAFDEACQNYSDTYVYYYVKCAKDNTGAMVGIQDVAYSICDGNTKFGCDSSGNTTSESCTSCAYSASTYAASCDGSSGGDSSQLTEPDIQQNSCNLSSDALSSISVVGTCTSSNSNCEVVKCDYDGDYEGYFVDYMTCTNYAGNYYWTPADTYKSCASGCNTAGTDCDDNGGSLYEYQSSSDSATCKEVCVQYYGSGYDAYCPTDDDESVECLNSAPTSGYTYCGDYYCS